MSEDPGRPPSSPAWKRPTDLMKIRSKRRSSQSNATATRPALRPFNDVKSPTRSPQSSPARKRRNPFTCSPSRKKLNLDSDGQDVNADSDFLLFQMLDKADKAFSPPSKSTKPAKPAQIFDVTHGVETEDATEEDEIKGFDMMPVDWSLKTKIRFVSEKPFNWTCPMKTLEESKGISLYVRQNSELPVSDITEQSELKSSCMYWIHPNLPWLNLVPRLVQDSRIGKPSSVTLDDHMISQLHRDWCQSLASLFNLLKADICPYFYVLAHQFSVLFRSKSLCRGDQSAIITPTTRGLREALASEGINFSMPLATNDNDTTDEEALLDDNDIQNSDSGASLFLESIGVDQQNFPELNPDKVKLEREGFKRIDSRPESLVLIQGDETKQLFNYLLNCRSCIANTGIQRGIPPTLLAPVAFTGATLKSLMMRQGSLRQSGKDGAAVKMFSLEVSGALLPDGVSRLCDLLSRTQENFTVSFNTHEPTSTFNEMKKHIECESYYADQTEGFLSRPRPKFDGTIRSMEYRDGNYFCSNT